MPNIETLLTTMIQPLITYPEDLSINVEETDEFTEYYINVHPDDIGRVIGRKGRVIRAIRTIVYSIRNLNDKRTRIIVNDEEN